MNFLFAEHRLIHRIGAIETSESTEEKLGALQAREAVLQNGSTFNAEISKHLDELIKKQPPQFGHEVVSAGLNVLNPPVIMDPLNILPDATDLVPTTYIQNNISAYYNNAINENAWTVEFTKPNNAVLPASTNLSTNPNDTVTSIWESLDPISRREVCIVFLLEHFGSEPDLKTELKAMATLPPVAFFTHPRLPIFLSLRAAQRGLPINPVLSIDDVDAAQTALFNKYAFLDGAVYVPNHRLISDIRTECQRQWSSGVQLDDIRDIDKFRANIPTSDLKGALNLPLVQSWVPDLIEKFITEEQEKNSISIEQNKQIASLRSKIEKASPSTFEQLTQNFQSAPPWAKLAAVGLGAFLLYRSFRSITTRDPNRSPPLLAWATILGTGALLTRPLFENTVIGDAIDSTGNALDTGLKKSVDGVKYMANGAYNLATGRTHIPLVVDGQTAEHTASENARDESDTAATIEHTRSLLNPLVEYLDTNGESLPVKDMMTSLVITRIPFSVLMQSYTLDPDARSGTLTITTELRKEILLRSGGEPQNSIILSQVVKNKKVWGDAIAHMLYTTGVYLSDNSEYRRLHSQVVEPARVDATGDFDAITNTGAREAYVQIAEKGQEIAMNSQMTIGELLFAISDRNR